MKLSQKGQYGVRAAFMLAMHYDEGPLALKLIAEDQGIPEAFLEQILQALKRTGLVGATRGARGGYTLARAPESIAVGDVLTALEVNLSPVECLDGSACERQHMCAMRLVYERLGQSTLKILHETTLLDMVRDHRRLTGACEEETHALS